MLAASGETAYISEPLNVLHRPGVMRLPVQRWYTYICPDNESDYLPALRQTVNYRYHLWAELTSLRSRRDVLRMGRDWVTFVKGRILRLRPLLKDPFALFSIRWFAERLGCQVVITVRHPAAFASSLMRLNWTFQLEDLLAQPLLMRDWLEPYRLEMEGMPAGDVLGRASLLWKMAYQMVHDLRLKHPEYHIVRHEDFSANPVECFGALYGALGLQFTPQAQATVQATSSPANPKELPADAVHAFQLDSRASLSNWKRRLSAEDVRRIRTIAGDVAAYYYPEESWD
jgi:hypothetical protein